MPIMFLIDDPELAASRVVEVDIASGAVVKQHESFTDRLPAPASWHEDAPYLLDAGEVIVPAPRLELVIDYPLARPVHFSLETEGGFTRLELCSRICELYEHIYELEARTTKTPVGNAGTLSNRNRTDGTFGISAHHLSDLVIEGVVVGTHGGERWVTLEMGS